MNRSFRGGIRLLRGLLEHLLGLLGGSGPGPRRAVRRGSGQDDQPDDSGRFLDFDKTSTAAGPMDNATADLLLHDLTAVSATPARMRLLREALDTLAGVQLMEEVKDLEGIVQRGVAASAVVADAVTGTLRWSVRSDERQEDSAIRAVMAAGFGESGDMDRVRVEATEAMTVALSLQDLPELATWASNLEAANYVGGLRELRAELGPAREERPWPAR